MFLISVPTVGFAHYGWSYTVDLFTWWVNCLYNVITGKETSAILASEHKDSVLRTWFKSWFSWINPMPEFPQVREITEQYLKVNINGFVLVSETYFFTSWNLLFPHYIIFSPHWSFYQAVQTLWGKMPRGCQFSPLTTMKQYRRRCGSRWNMRLTSCCE